MIGQRILRLLKPRKHQLLFEVHHGSQTRFVTFDEWYRDHKQNVLIEYRIGRVGNSNRLIRIHPALTKGNSHEQ
jgi:hypothetical protein